MKDFIKKIKSLQKKTDSLYIYGAGVYARNIYKILHENKVSVEGFLVTSEKCEECLFGLPVLYFSEITRQNIGIVLGLSALSSKNVKNYLYEHDFDMKNVIDGGSFLENNSARHGYGEKIPSMEITTRIGCKVDCKYCPQDNFLNAYYHDNKNREAVMSLDTFRKCLDKLPQNCNVIFSGEAEPFLNPLCKEMIKMAIESGRTVDLYTTLVGVNKELLKEIIKIPFGFVVLHVADKNQYAKIPVTTEYLEMLRLLVECKKENGKDFIDMCNAQAEPDIRVKEIFCDKKEILYTLADRAGNLECAELYHKRGLQGKLSCTFCGVEFNHNVLLPDGSVLLCCNDFGMKHVLGNLLEQSYEEIMNGNEMKKVKRGVAGDMTQDILCRNCTCANKIE